MNASPLPHPIAARWARRLLGLPPLAWFALCGLASMLIYFVAFTRPYGLDEHGEKSRQNLATLSDLSTGAAVRYVLAYVGLFAVYWVGYRMAIRPLLKNPPRLRMGYAALILGFGLIFNGILLSIYPFDAADVYDYIMRGRMAAFYDLNPMQDIPADASDDPAYAYTAWRFVPSAYGPAWERIAEGTVRTTGDSINADVVAFKLVAMAGFAVTALFIGLTLHEIAPRRLLAGVYLFAWNPVMIVVTGGTAHNDMVMMACMLVGVYLMARRWYVASVGALMLGALVKFIPLAGIPIVGLVAFSRLDFARQWRFVLLAGLLCAALFIGLYAPYWHGLDTLPDSDRSEMFTGSVATLIRQELGPVLDDAARDAGARDTPNASRIVSGGALLLMAIFYVALLPRVYKSRDDLTPIHALTLIIFFYLLVASVWFLYWYVVWLIPLAVLLDNRPLRRLALLFSYLVTWEHLMYNFVTLRADGWTDVPWRDLGPVAVVMGGIYLSIAYVWLSHGLRGGTRTPLREELGARLRSAREDADLSLIDLADELAIPTDDLAAYERGDLPILLDVVEALSVRLDMELIYTMEGV